MMARQAEAGDWGARGLPVGTMWYLSLRPGSRNGDEGGAVVSRPGEDRMEAVLDMCCIWYEVRVVARKRC